MKYENSYTIRLLVVPPPPPQNFSFIFFPFAINNYNNRLREKKATIVPGRLCFVLPFFFLPSTRRRWRRRRQSIVDHRYLCTYVQYVYVDDPYWKRSADFFFFNHCYGCVCITVYTRRVERKKKKSNFHDVSIRTRLPRRGFGTRKIRTVLTSPTRNV